MAIQTVIQGRRGPKEEAVERLKNLRDQSEELTLQEEELQSRVSKLRDPEVPLPEGADPEIVERSLQTVQGRKKSLEEDFSTILEMPVDQLQGGLVGISDEKIQEGVSETITKRADKRLIGSGTPIEIDSESNIVDPVTGEAIAADQVLEEQLRDEANLLTSYTADLSPEAQVDLRRNMLGLLDDSTVNDLGQMQVKVGLGLNSTKTRIPNQRETFDPAIKTVRELMSIPDDYSSQELEYQIGMSLLTVGEGAYGKEQSYDTSDLDEAPSFEEQFEALENLDLEVLEGGGIEKESFTNMMKSQLRSKVITQPVINEEGLPVQRTPIDEDAMQQATEVIIASLVNQGLIKEGKVKQVSEKVEGRLRDIQGYNPEVPVYYLQKNIYDTIIGARLFIRSQNKNNIPKRASQYPGGRQGALKDQGQIVGSKKDAEAIKYEKGLSRVAHYVDGQALAFGTAMLVATEQLASGDPLVKDQMDVMLPSFAELSDAVMNTKLFKDTAVLDDRGLRRLEQARQQEAAKARQNIADVSYIYARGTQTYLTYTTQAMNMRAQITDNDFNPQSYKIHRGVAISGRPVKVNTSFKNRTIQSNESYIPAPIIAQLKDRVSKEDYKPLQDGELEASHLFTIAYNLFPDIAGRKPNGLAVETILESITPEFMSRAAEVGRILNRMFPKDQVTKEAFTNEDALRAAVIDNMTTLFPEEKALLQTYLPKMSKEDWGYKFRSYIAAADYLDTPGNSIMSNVTVEYDYNSAGLTFMQTDAGRESFLRLTGVISEFQQSVYEDALAIGLDSEGNVIEGSPRNAFLDKIVDYLDASEVQGNSAKKVAGALNAAKFEASSKKRLVKMAKAILLTIGYAKPAMFQHETIRDAFEEIPELQTLQNEGVDVVNILNFAVSQSVRDIIETKFSTKVKQATQIMTMLDLPPYLETESGLQVPLFKSGYAEIEGTTPIEVVSKDGKSKLVAQKEKVPMLRERSKPKSTGDTVFVAPSGAAVPNRPGAIGGQQRETMAVKGSFNRVNTGYGREDTPIYSVTTFDNTTTNAEGAIFFRAAMNGQAAKDALSFNNTAAFLETASDKIKERIMGDELPSTIVLNKDTNFGILLEQIQLMNQRLDADRDDITDLAQQKLDEVTRPKVQRFMEFLKNHPDPEVNRLLEVEMGSNESVTLNREQFKQVLANFMHAVDLNITSFKKAANESRTVSKEIMEMFPDILYFAG